MMSIEPDETSWQEIADQSALVRVLGQVECGFTTHADLVGVCRWCGAAV